MFSALPWILLVWLNVCSSTSEVREKGMKCPRECTCVIAPLRSAPFVLTWMTSWGEDDLPEIHPNEVLKDDMLAKSETASDADVDVDVEGLHATCSLHQTTNITELLTSLPSTIMVLSILQAPGSNLTIVDGGQLVNLSSLRALHLQGYAHVKRKQVSGYEPNSVPEFMAHKKLIEKELRENRKQTRDLRLALAEDALQPLSNLQLLDLQYVRLVASKEARRSRRYSKEPLASTTLLDMPLKQFLRLANNVDSFYLPPHLQYLSRESREKSSEALNEGRPGIGTLGESYKLQRDLFLDETDEQGNELLLKDALKAATQNQQDTKEGDDDDDDDDDSDIVPYSIYKAEVQPQLAPFQKLKKLKYLRVAHARLDKIGPELLDGLQSLHTLTLEYNRIKILPTALFAPTPSLRHLSLAHNNLLLLDSESLEGLSKLLTIDLDSNQLSVLGPASFPSLPSLKTLRVSDNPLTHLLPDTFAALNSSEEIILGSYGIPMDVHINSFRFLQNLNSLVMNNVSMDRLQKPLLMGMPRVQRIEIHGNIKEVDYDAFSSTPYLKSLNLSYCHISLLSLDAFYGLTQLVNLDLSFNDLVAVSPGTFDHLTSLRELYLNNNHLTTLPLGIFIPIPAKLIQLHNNPWFCTCDLLQLRPSVTNKVKRPGQVVCVWDDKLATVCKKTKDRLVYDARVAPLCHEPIELVGNDVYHAALRHLKCSKYHWDPRLLIKEKKKIPEVVERNEAEAEEEEEEEEDSVERANWLPLTAFTPEPVDTEDLLEIAEREGLEEVIEEVTTEARPKEPSPTESKPNKIVSKEKSNGGNKPQSDQPLLFKATPSKHLSYAITKEHKERKARMKAMMKARAFRKKAHKSEYMKRKYLKEKSHLKSIISSRQREFERRRQRKDDIYSSNFIRSNSLKSNIDLY